MNPDITERLVKRFPILYQDYSYSASETAMCWGFSHGDGWFEIVWQLSLAIEEELGYSWLEERWFLLKKRLWRWLQNLRFKASILQLNTGFAVSEVKEKFGTLRFCCGATETIHKYIRLAERLSAVTCEDCGEPGSRIEHRGWISTLCDSCRKKLSVQARLPRKRG